MILNERESRHEHVLHVARHITFSYPLKTRDLQKMLA